MLDSIKDMEDAPQMNKSSNEAGLHEDVADLLAARETQEQIFNQVRTICERLAGAGLASKPFSIMVRRRVGLSHEKALKTGMSPGEIEYQEVRIPFYFLPLDEDESSHLGILLLENKKKSSRF